MLADNELIAFVPVTDLERSRHFYSGKLGLPVISSNEVACAFDARGCQLHLTVVPELEPTAYTVVGWSVADLESVCADLIEHGIAPLQYEGVEQSPLGIWIAPTGDHIAWLADPDGNVLSLTEFHRGNSSDDD